MELIACTGPAVILQKQYRPALGQMVIELPAGLVDEGETPQQAAIRELEEETGYIAKVEEMSPVMFNGMCCEMSPHFPTLPDCFLDPGFCNTNLRMAHVTLDMDRVENKDPKPKPQGDEFIQVFKVPLADLCDKCVEFEADGCVIDAGVAMLVEGIKIVKKFKEAFGL